ncbi:urate hydroxylase PuuD [Cobetia sp. L2A1]|uniref:urate hydroxylase PuuD n=1 Tax=Cobetia sp. L2A1 TaxID=2686360 RepID=UPI00131CCC7C|nr:urate hydroxylase PuuD [Cobetia sp. L2A1]
MSAYLLDWAMLLTRWLHVMAGIAWIGASFFFIWLDNRRQPARHAVDGRPGGELWAVHGGGLYHLFRHDGVSETLPSEIHWFKWEAYVTWLSGMGLFTLIYLLQPQAYLIDPRVFEMSGTLAVCSALGLLVGGWLGYEAICRSPLKRNAGGLFVAVGVWLTLAAWLATELFSGRAAFLLMGALMGSIMAGNVFNVIIPGQKALLAAAQRGETPDPMHGQRAKQRSVHNTFITLPAVLMMISNHYPLLYANEYRLGVILLLLVTGGLIRIATVDHHKGVKRLWVPVGALLALIGVIVLCAPRPQAVSPATESSEPVAASGTVGEQGALREQVTHIIEQRCAGCHSDTPNLIGLTAPAAGVAFNGWEDIQRQALRIHQRTVVDKSMPLANMTQMTDAERQMLDDWWKASQ